MTTPQAPPAQQAPPPGAGLSAGLQVAIARQLLTAVSAAAAVQALVLRYKLSADMQRALESMFAVSLQNAPPVTGVTGPGSSAASRQNLTRRSAFVLASARRLAGDMADARAHGRPVAAALSAGLARERRFHGQHLAAVWQRAVAAGKIDTEAAAHGLLLGWYAVHDRKTTAECRWADGRNFRADQPPAIGLPGIGPHVNCRCTAGPPHPGGAMLPAPGTRYARAA